MKNIKLIVFSFIVVLFSCEKNKIQDEEISEFIKIKEFNKEIVVHDTTGRNTVFLRIHSDDEKLLENYVKNNVFIIETFSSDVDFNAKSFVEEKMFAPVEQFSSESGYSLSGFNLNSEEEILIEVVTTNLENNIKGYFFEIIPARLKVIRWDIPISLTTPNKFLGIVHKGGGHEFAARMYYWTSWWQFNFGSPTQMIWNGANTFFLHPFGEGYYAWMNFDSYRKRIVINQWHDDVINNIENYKFIQIIEDFRGTNCSYIGSYDGANCKAGTAPEGTTAFIYNDRFYHTPLPGNVCPIPGSIFDGANCRVAKIPEGTVPFIYNNGWYVEPDHLFWD